MHVKACKHLGSRRISFPWSKNASCKYLNVNDLTRTLGFLLEVFLNPNRAKHVPRQASVSVKLPHASFCGNSCRSKGSRCSAASTLQGVVLLLTWLLWLVS